MLSLKMIGIKSYYYMKLGGFLLVVFSPLLLSGTFLSI